MLPINYLLSTYGFLLFWFIYLVLCVPLVYLLLLIIPQRLRLNWLILFILFYIFSASIIIFGILIALVIALVLRFQKPVKKEKRFFDMVDYPDYQHAPNSEVIEYGESSGFKIVTNKSLSKALRQKMLVAINQFETSSTNQINSIALSDDTDEVRLYAHSLIEKQERRYSRLIKELNLKLSKTTDGKSTAYFKKQIAEVLWEQVYRYLIINENLVVTLDKIKMYATEALEHLSKDMELPLLLAKVALRQADLEEARKWLNIATINQAPEYKILASLAEIEYLQRNYDQVKNIFKRFHNKGVMGLQPIKSFWLHHD